MKSRVWVYGGVLIALVVGAALTEYDSAELSALAWHARHGFHAELGGIRIRVPLFFEAQDPGGTSMLVIERTPSLLRRGGMMFVDFGRHPSFEAEQAAEQAAETKLQNVIVRRQRVSEREATLAGRPGKCIESVPVFVDARYQQLSKLARGIDCWFGDDVKATFIGSADLTADFYSMIQTAEAVKRKH